jgi:hypothetical protein
MPPGTAGASYDREISPASSEAGAALGLGQPPRAPRPRPADSIVAKMLGPIDRVRLPLAAACSWFILTWPGRALPPRARVTATAWRRQSWRVSRAPLSSAYGCHPREQMSDSSSDTVAGAEGAAAVATSLYCNVPSVLHRVVALQSPARKAAAPRPTHCPCG